MRQDFFGKVDARIAFETVYREHWKKIYNYVYGRLLSHEVAEDVTAEVFIAAWQNFEKYNPEISKISTWIGTIAHHKVDDFLRRAYRQREISVGEIPEAVTKEEPFFETGDELAHSENQQVCVLLQRLSHEERNLLELRYVLEMDNQDVAKLFGTTANAVSHRYTRLLDKCRKIIV